MSHLEFRPIRAAEGNLDLKSSEDVDIYSDVLTDQNEIILKKNKCIEDLIQDKKLLMEQLNDLQKRQEQLQINYQELQSKYQNVSFNLSSVFKTAQAEIKRKDRTIKELRKDYDNMVFRKAPSFHSEKRRRRYYSPKKVSPKKFDSSTIKPNEEGTLEESKDPQQDPEEISLEETMIEESTREERQLSEHFNNSVSDLSDESNVKKILPPLHGPTTLYSSRLYKKIHGVSPEKTISHTTQQNVLCVVKGNNSLDPNMPAECGRSHPYMTINQETMKIQQPVKESESGSHYYTTTDQVESKLQKSVEVSESSSPHPYTTTKQVDSKLEQSEKEFDSSSSHLFKTTNQVDTKLQISVEEYESCSLYHYTTTNQVDSKLQQPVKESEISNSHSYMKTNQLVSKLQQRVKECESGSSQPYATTKQLASKLRHSVKESERGASHPHTTTDKTVSKLQQSVKESLSDNSRSYITTNQVASKLQQQVKEIIKLGSKSEKTACSSDNKLQHSEYVKHQMNCKLTDSNHQGVKLPEDSKKSTSLVIKCDLREVSIDETLENIIKRHKAGKSDEIINTNNNQDLVKENVSHGCYAEVPSSGLTDLEISSNKLNEDGGNIKTNKCNEPGKNSKVCSETTSEKTTSYSKINVKAHLSNKKVVKPIISPATFGKLVHHDKNYNKTKSVYDTNLHNTKVQEKTLTSSSSIFSPEKDGSKVIKLKKSACLQLFGESPLKCNHSKIMSPGKVMIPPSVSPVRCASPILPSSPSLDSDNTEDLIIDSTVCSLNVSPRVSESDQKDEVCNTKTPDPETNSHALKKKAGSHKKDCNLASSPLQMKSNNNILQPICNKETSNGTSTVTDSLKEKVIMQNKLSDLNSPIDGEVFPFPPTKSGHDKNTFSPELSESYSLDSINQITPFSNLNNTMGQNICESQKPSLLPHTPHNLTLEQNTGECEINKKEDKNKISKNDKNDDVQTAQRFIPSPPQLTLVSAFKHSENSVFNLTDTLGFVNALTRVRDISPIKTPDKNEKITIETKDSQVFYSTDSNIVINNTKGYEDILKTIKSPFVSFTNIKCNRSPSADALESTAKVDLENEIINISYSEKIIDNIKSSSHMAETQSLDDCGTVLQKSANTNVDICNRLKMPLTAINNGFKRIKPVRRVDALISTNEEILAQPVKENIAESDPSFAEIKDVTRNGNEGQIKNYTESEAQTKSCPLMLPNQKNNKCDITSTDSTIQPNINETNIKSKICNITNKVVDDASTANKVKEVMQGKSEDDNSPNKNTSSMDKLTPHKTIISSVYSDKTSFKRSESLKGMPKPILKVNYDTLSNTCIYTERTNNKKARNLKEEISELAQLPYIASINKRVRISKWQGDRKILNLQRISPEQSQHVLHCDKIKRTDKKNEKGQSLKPQSNLNKEQPEATLSSQKLHAMNHYLSKSSPSEPKSNRLSLSGSGSENNFNNCIEVAKIKRKLSKSNGECSDNDGRENNNRNSIEGKQSIINSTNKSPNVSKRPNNVKVRRNKSRSSKSESPEHRYKTNDVSMKMKHENNQDAHKSKLSTYLKRSHSKSPDLPSKYQLHQHKKKQPQIAEGIHGRKSFSQRKRSHGKSSNLSPCRSGRRSLSRSPNYTVRTKHRRNRSEDFSPSPKRYRSRNININSCYSHRNRNYNERQYRRSRSPVELHEYYNKKTYSNKNKCDREPRNNTCVDKQIEEKKIPNKDIFCEELERMRKDLEQVKSQIIGCRVNKCTDSNPNSKLLESNVMSAEEPTNISPTYPNMLSNSEKTAPLTDDIMTKSCHNQTKNTSCTVEQTNNVLSERCSAQLEKSSGDLSFNPIRISCSTPKNDTPLKFIKIVRRRQRSLGDSDVIVVSSSSTSKPQHSNKSKHLKRIL